MNYCNTPSHAPQHHSHQHNHNRTNSDVLESVYQDMPNPFIKKRRPSQSNDYMADSKLFSRLLATKKNIFIKDSQNHSNISEMVSEHSSPVFFNPKYDDFPQNKSYLLGGNLCTDIFKNGNSNFSQGTVAKMASFAGKKNPETKISKKKLALPPLSEEFKIHNQKPDLNASESPSGTYIPKKITHDPNFFSETPFAAHRGSTKTFHIKKNFQSKKTKDRTLDDSTLNFSELTPTPGQEIHRDYNQDNICIFKGSKSNSLRSGYGEEFFPGGILKFKGFFQGDLYQGKGQLYLPDSTLKYQGSLSQGLKEGYGVLYYPSSSNGKIFWEEAFVFFGRITC